MASPERPEPQRPLSPYMLGSVYRLQLTSVMSLLHRVTGLLLAVAALGFAWFVLAIAAGPAAYAEFLAVAGSLPGQLVAFVVTLALAYHLFNGVRHLLWDAGVGLELPAVYRGGYLVALLTLVSATLLWLWMLGGAS